MPSTRALIHAPWSASKVATALRCPRLFHYKYVDKIREPEVNPEARIGKAIHRALELSLHGRPLSQACGEAITQLANEDEVARFEQLATGIPPFLTRIGQFRKQRRVQRQLVEYSLAVREDLSPTAFYSSEAYYRGVVDVGYLFDDDMLAIVDHKTGKPFPAAERVLLDQLGGYAVLAHASFRHVDAIWLGVHWVADRALQWSTPLPNQVVAQKLGAELLDNIEAAALAVDDGPRTNPGSYCDRCVYRHMCPASREPRYDWYDYVEEEDDD